jgi:hypothetical protein
MGDCIPKNGLVMNYVITTKNQLSNALFATSLACGAIKLGHIELTGVLSIERESGNGKTFNVTGYNLQGEKVTVFCSTID